MLYPRERRGWISEIVACSSVLVTFNRVLLAPFGPSWCQQPSPAACADAYALVVPTGCAGETHGVVKWFNSPKGFGFITPADGRDDIFVHHSAINCGGFRCLTEGDQVSFNLHTDRDGRTKACDVTVTAAAAPLAEGDAKRPPRRQDEYAY